MAKCELRYHTLQLYALILKYVKNIICEKQAKVITIHSANCQLPPADMSIM